MDPLACLNINLGKCVFNSLLFLLTACIIINTFGSQCLCELVSLVYLAFKKKNTNAVPDIDFM